VRHVWLHVTKAARLLLAWLGVRTRCSYRHMLPRLCDSSDAAVAVATSSTVRLMRGSKSSIWETIGSARQCMEKNTSGSLEMSLSHS
jgi:hypothetical protein